jgi:hypothetical protein
MAVRKQEDGLWRCDECRATGKEAIIVHEPACSLSEEKMERYKKSTNRLTDRELGNIDLSDIPQLHEMGRSDPRYRFRSVRNKLK